MNEKSNYIVVLKAQSSARFKPERPLIVTNCPSPMGPVKLIFRTIYVNEGFSVPIPRELWIKLTGSAQSLDSAIKSFSIPALVLVPVIALSVNAPIDTPEVNIAYDNTQGKDGRDFFESFLPDEKGLIRQGRTVNTDATVDLLTALDNHPHQARLLRAINQYSVALLNWKPGREIIAGAHLYMGIDTLTKIALSNYCEEKGKSEIDLVKEWGIEKQELDSKVRERILFQGDTDCYKKAKKASDGFEHGYVPFPDIYTISTEIRDLTAYYLRSSIIDLIRPKNSARSILLSTPFKHPLQSWEITKQIKGRLISKSDKLAKEGQEYPYIKWNSEIKSITCDESGEYNIEMQETFTNLFTNGVSFQPDVVEVYGPKKDSEDS